MNTPGGSGRKRLIGVAILLLVLAVPGCDHLGLPKLALEETSPTGGSAAQVRNELSLDPPNQSLWIADGDGSNAERVLQLSEDQDWCDDIAWSADGSTVAFLVRRAWIAVFDAGSRQLLASDWLTQQARVPPQDEVREIALSADGSRVRFRLCDRTTGRCAEPQEVEVRDLGEEGADAS